MTYDGVVGFEVLALHERGFTIRNYFFYGQDELLHLECQWQVDESAIAAGCEELLGSLTF